MKTLRNGLVYVVMTFLITLTSQAALAQDGYATCDFNGGYTDEVAVFADLYSSGVTSGDYADSRQGVDFDGWTWEKDGNDLIVRDDMGVIAMTFIGRGNSNNTSGAISDGPSSGDNGGNWEILDEA